MNTGTYQHCVVPLQLFYAELIELGKRRQKGNVHVRIDTRVTRLC